jgi:ribA/ribD-fused uncharacterized protein
MDRQSLEDQIAHGKQFRYVFFWGHTQTPGTIGPTCMSQWYESSFLVDGIEYPTAEHFMMAEKARLFGDLDMEQTILDARHPGEAKKCGRLVKGFDHKVWDDNKFDIVVRGNLAKFSQHDGLRQYLLDTGDRILVEASPHDRIWGLGLGKKDPNAGNPVNWRGENLLGFALMDVREALKDPDDKLT